jgi:hypothetical protein
MILITAGTFGYYQEASITPSGFGNSYKVDCETAQASLPAAGRHYIQQRFEGHSLQHLKKGSASAEKLSIGFWVYSNKTGTYIAELLDIDNTRHICASYTIDSASTWEYKIITFASDTSGPLDNDKENSLSLNFWLAAGSDYSGGTLATSWASTTSANRAVGQVNFSDSTANNFYISGIQVVPGDYVGPFEHLTYDRYLANCERFYYKTNVLNAAANAYSTTAVANCTQSFPTTMRIVPSTLTISGVSLQSNLGTYSSVSSWRATRNGVSPTFTVTGATAGYAGYASFSFTADAEL